jgi:hypothetical protein
MTRRRTVTEQAATAAIEQGCRMLRLPTIRDRFAEIAAAAERDQMTYLGFLSELVIAECDDRTRRRAERRIRAAGFPRPKRLEEFSLMPTLRSTRRSSVNWPAAPGSRLDIRCV